MSVAKRRALGLALFAGALLAGQCLTTWFALVLERREQEARLYFRERSLKVLALRSMDQVVAPLVAVEAARPAEHFRPLVTPRGVLGPRMQPLPNERLELRSPLLSVPPALVRLHFTAETDGAFASPQAPDPELAAIAVDRGWTTEAAVARAAELVAELGATFDADALGAAFDAAPAAPPGRLVPVLVAPDDDAPADLFLLARGAAPDEPPLYGAWLDRELLAQRLLNVARPVFGERSVDLVDAGARRGAEPDLRLATLPLALSVESEPAVERGTWTATRAALAIAWGALLLALAGFGLALRAAWDLSARRGRFVASVTHELRTPLTTFCLYTEMLAKGMVPDADARQSYLETLERESARLRAVVDNVLLFARVETGRAHLETAPHGLLELWEGVREVAERRAADADLELDATDLVAFASAPDAPRVEADPTAFAQAVTNLVDNAAKYAAPPAGSRVTLTARRARSGVEIEVTDDGPGIPPGAEQKLFEPFERGPGESERATSGVGLGLSLTRGLMRAMGGDLRLVAGRAPGAVFALRLRTVRR